MTLHGKTGLTALRSGVFLQVICYAIIVSKAVYAVESSVVQCIDSAKEGTKLACVVDNIVTYNGTVYFVSDADDVKVPKIFATLKEIFGNPPVIVTPTVIKPGEFLSMVDAAKAEVVKTKFGVLASFPNHGNVLHIIGEFLTSLQNSMCLLGLCGFESVKDTLLVNVLPTELPKNIHYNPAIKQAFQCYGRTERPLWLQEPEFKAKVHVFERAVIGYGDVCFQHCRHDKKDDMGRSGMNSSMFESFRRRMHSCLGLPFPVASSREHPVITILNRQYGVGRTILNSRDLADGLRRVTGAVVHEVFFEGMPYVEQAKTIQRTSVLVMVHGAGLASALYLPSNSIIVHLLQHPGYYIHLHDYAWQWTNAMGPSDVSLVRYTNTDRNRLHVMLEKASKTKWYQTLNETGRCMLMTQKMCVEQMDSSLRQSCIFESFHSGSNIAVNIGEVLPLVNDAVNAIRQREKREEL